MYAHIADGTITETRHTLPPTWLHDGRAWDLRPDSGTNPADAGWHTVTLVSRPEDTPTTTHNYDGVQMVDGTPTQVWTPRPWTEAETRAHAETAARLDDLAAKVALLWAAMFPPDPEPEPGEPVTAPAFDGIWHPGRVITDTDGRVYRNTSGQPLVHPPSAMTLDGGDAWIGSLYVLVTGDTDPDPDPGPGTPANYRGPWSPDTDYAVDDTCSRHGHYWQALVAHGAAYAGTWGPPTAGVWTDLGPQ